MNIIEFGAVNDGITLNTEAIQKAIDKCAEAGGGRVVIPQGKFKSGTIWLKSNVELHLEMGAELIASDNLDDYNDLDAYEQNFSILHEEWVGKHLIIAHEIENSAITGLGKINGNCCAFVTKIPSPQAPWTYYHWNMGISKVNDEVNKRPGQLICFIECANVHISDVTIVDSPCWCCFIHGCENVFVRGIRVKNPMWMLNSDGIDIDASRNVTVSDCIIDTGDDGITLRAGEHRIKNKNIHCENVTVTNCVINSGVCAFRIGVGRGTIKHARISNITVSKSYAIAQLCTAYSMNPLDKVDIEDVNFSNISAVDTCRAIEAFAKNGAFLKNITFENIRSESSMVNLVDGTDGVVENFNIRNVEIYMGDKYTELNEDMLARRGTNALKIASAKGVSLENVKIYGEMVQMENVASIENSTEVYKHNCNF